MKIFTILLLLAVVGCASQQVALDGSDDPNLWLENIDGAKALTWVKGQNKKTLDEITTSQRFNELQDEALDILQAKDKIPYVRMAGNYLYNFWQDDKHVRGVWRRTSLKSFKNKKPRWETVLDLDALAKKEKENWVYKGVSCLAPRYERCMFRLSRGGKDAVVIREFNARSKSFVKKGFQLPEAKSWVAWFDKDHLMVATKFGEGSLTESGYPRMVKLWKRGATLEKAIPLIEADKAHMAAYPSRFDSSTGPTLLVSRWETFYTTSYNILENGKVTPVPIRKTDSILGVFKNHFITELRKPWTVEGRTFPQGSLVAVKRSVVQDNKVTAKEVALIHTPTKNGSLLNTLISKDSILINELENVSGRILQVKYGRKGFSKPQPINYKGKEHLTIASVSPYKKDFFFNVSGFLTPDSYYLYRSGRRTAQKLKSLPAKFNPKGMEVRQYWATSRDGTKVPYFVVGKSEQMKRGKVPTLLYGYGGFEISLTPKYKPVVGKLWMEKGGLYVLANIRGGGEFGPKWHQAALKTNRQRAYDDFISVGEDLVNRGITTNDQLAIQGGSNGGLLVGAVMTQRPDLFKAVLCHVPLLDMVRYSQLLAGASWVAEYGDPKDEKMRDYILTYSPYHNVKANKKYPELFIMTSTKDDRVHPGHARKMTAKMQNLGHKNIRYYENTEGGHAASANLKQKARMRALSFEFLYKTIYR